MIWKHAQHRAINTAIAVIADHTVVYWTADDGDCGIKIDGVDSHRQPIEVLLEVAGELCDDIGKNLDDFVKEFNGDAQPGDNIGTVLDNGLPFLVNDSINALAACNAIGVNNYKAWAYSDNEVAIATTHKQLAINRGVVYLTRQELQQLLGLLPVPSAAMEENSDVLRQDLAR